MRVGIGYDIHRFVEGRKLFLAGTEIPYVKGLLSYTDGDVVLHAVADAMLGALAMGDIGQHFPDTNPEYKDMSSSMILKEVLRIVAQKKWTVRNIDTMILAEEPKLYPFRDKMRDCLAAITGINKDRVNIKATTNEGVGSIGRGDAIAAYAVVMLEEG